MVESSRMITMGPTRAEHAEAHRGYVFAIARRIVGDRDAAEDVTQDALLLAHRHRDAFRGESQYRTWLYRIAVTTALGYLRRERRRSSLPLGDVLDVPDVSRSTETDFAWAEHCALVTRALDELPPTYRDVLLARVDASEPEVAAHLGISVANVKIRTHRARKQLRAALERYEPAAA